MKGTKKPRTRATRPQFSGMGSSTDALYQMKLARENQIKSATAYRERARVSEQYLMASRRNDLEVERANLGHYVRRLPQALQGFYFDRIRDLSDQIDSPKRKCPMHR